MLKNNRYDCDNCAETAGWLEDKPKPAKPDDRHFCSSDCQTRYFELQRKLLEKNLLRKKATP